MKIYINTDSLNAILDNVDLYSDHEYPATFVFQNSLTYDSIANVGFRLRGNTSREAAKKSFKVSLNAFQNNSWNGLEKLNLNANSNDPSLMRAKLNWDMIREAGLAGSRTAYVNLYINGEYKGVYVNTEHIDENFAATYFDQSGDGNLFKCLYPADLDFLGSNPDLYKLEVFGRRIYELKTNEYADNYSDIASFINTLNNSPSNQFICNLRKEFNVDDYLKYAALEVLQGHWDGYIFNKNNFYLYHDQFTNKMQWIPYDLDNTLGIDWFSENWAGRNIYNWDQSGQMRPLYEELMSVDVFRNQYSAYIDEYINSFFTPEWIEEKVTQYQTLLAPYLENDLYYTLDYGFSVTDFLNSYEETWGGHVTSGIEQYISTRQFNASVQLDDINSFIEITRTWDTGPAVPHLVFAEVPNSPDNVSLLYAIDGTAQASLSMLDNGVFPDAAIDGIYTALINVNATNGNQLTYQVEATEGTESTLAPCAAQVIWLSPSSNDIVLNEMMSANTASIQDESGEFADWIELFNNGSNPLNLNNYYLTDEMGNWNKWKLGATTLNPGNHHLVWADSDEEDGELHTNFNLSASGETIWLCKWTSNAFRYVDFQSIPALNDNQSFGRASDGNENWIFFTNTTPDAPNGVVNIDELASSNILFYPNPTQNVIYFHESVSRIVVFDAMGKNVLTQSNARQLAVDQLAEGVYILDCDGFYAKLVISR
ncbi:MAG: CotH kinase family protein [Flavobacteriales bacterium]